MKIKESGEMYLETIYILSLNNKSVKSIDIANELSFSRASVSRAMKILEENEYIVFDDKKNIRLTDIGLQTALKTYESHKILAEFFVRIGVNEEIALKDACKIEHVISDDTISAIKNFLKDK